MSRITSILFLLIFILAITSCKEDIPPLVVPDTFDATGFDAATSTQSAVRSQLSALSNAMQVGRSADTSIMGGPLLDALSTGSPSLLDITTEYYSPLVGSPTSGWVFELAAASGNIYTLGDINDDGGVFGSYLFDENGIELEQLVEKGLFAAALYNHALTLMDGTIDENTAAQLVSIFGAHPDFPNSDNSSNHTNADIFMAKYTARRDKNDGSGLYTSIKTSFIKLQFAAAQGESYNTVRDEATAEIKDLWEKASAATVINYCHAAISGLSATNPGEADQASALHAYSEAVGFLHGWYSIAEKRITDTEIAEILTLMNAPVDSTPTSYTFATDPVNELPKLTQVIDRLKAIYGFTEAEIEDFKKNWVSEQGR